MKHQIPKPLRLHLDCRRLAGGLKSDAGNGALDAEGPDVAGAGRAAGELVERDGESGFFLKPQYLFLRSHTISEFLNKF